MKRNRLGGGGGEMDSLKLAHVLMLLSRGGGGGRVEGKEHMAQPPSGRVFECKTCSQRFPSFQALGGHRAKHKKPRPAGDGHGQTQVGAAKPRVHECSICGLELAVGQKESCVGGVDEKTPRDRRGMLVDLNMLPLEDDTKLADEIPMVNYLN